MGLSLVHTHIDIFEKWMNVYSLTGVLFFLCGSSYCILCVSEDKEIYFWWSVGAWFCINCEVL